MPESATIRTGTSLQEARRPWRLVCWVSGIFSVLIGVGMLAGHLSTKEADPLKSPELRKLKERLRDNPTEDATKVKIRSLDLQLRQKYFSQLNRMNSGVYLLLGSSAIFILAWTRMTACERKLPMPGPKAEDTDSPLRKYGRWAVAATGCAAAAVFIVPAVSVRTAVPKRQADIDKLLGTDTAETATPAVSVASAEELARNWPQFRGANGGVSAFTNAPVSWDTNTGAGIAWKTPLPTSGFNSPIIWGDRIFLSGGDAKAREVFCFDLKSGQLAWRKAISNVPGSPAQPPEIPDSTGYAAPTMATDGRRVYVMFANGDVAALTLEGKQVWSKGFGALKNPYGHATSLTMWKDRLIIQLDQGDSEENLSKLYALDGQTGKVLWQKPRKVGGSWASPIVVEAAGKPQVITLAVPWLISYSALDGTELWRADCLNGEVTPSPVFAGGLLLIASPSEKLIAIRPDGQGDVTKTHIVWNAEENVPDVTSPVCNGELVFTITTGGMLTCFDAKDGKKQWEHDFETEFHASPVISGNKLYLFSQKGNAVVVETARQFKQLFRADMGDAFHASPALVQDRIVLRGVRNLWCLGPSAQKIAQQ